MCACRARVAPRCIKAVVCTHLLPLRTSSPFRMSSTPFLLLLLSWTFLLSVSANPLAPPSPAPRHRRSNSPPLGFYDPRNNGGSWLTVRLRLRYSAFCSLYAQPKLIFPYPCLVFVLSSKSMTPSLLALANLSTSSSSRHLTPLSWLTKRIMEDYGITSCTSLLPARKTSSVTDLPASFPPQRPFPFYVFIHSR